MSEYYVVVKLVSGESIMATLEAEDENYVELHSPITIRTIPVQRGEQIAERVTAQPFNPYSDDKIYYISQANILYMKPLHETFISHYRRFVSEIEETVLVRKDHEGNVSRLDEEEPEELTLDEIERRIDMLQAIIKAPKTEKQEEDYKVYVEGNDTIN